MQNNTNVLFIGGGNMTQAIVRGLIASKYNPDAICVIDHNQAKCEFLTQTYNIKTMQVLDNNIVASAKVIILAVKPQAAHIACAQLLPFLQKHHPLIVSIMAGVTLNKLYNLLDDTHIIIRTMPNTPAAVMHGATGIYTDKILTVSDKQLVTSLFSTVGITAWLNSEADLDIITALSGSGPAYYFYFIELMSNIAIKLGLEHNIAKQFALQTAYGAAALALRSHEDPAKLRENVTSKNGTTAAALSIMQEKNLASILEESVMAAYKRAQELQRDN